MEKGEKYDFAKVITFPCNQGILQAYARKKKEIYMVKTQTDYIWTNCWLMQTYLPHTNIKNRQNSILVCFC